MLRWQRRCLFTKPIGEDDEYSLMSGGKIKRIRGENVEKALKVNVKNCKYRFPKTVKRCILLS